MGQCLLRSWPGSRSRRPESRESVTQQLAVLCGAVDDEQAVTGRAGGPRLEGGEADSGFRVTLGPVSHFFSNPPCSALGSRGAGQAEAGKRIPLQQDVWLSAEWAVKSLI